MLDAAPAEPAPVELPPTAPEEMKPRVWTVFLAYVAAVVGTISIQGAAVAIALAWWTAAGASPSEALEQLPQKLGTLEMFMLLAGCGQLAMVLTILIAAQRSPSPWRERLGLVPARSSWKVNLLAMVGSLVPLAIGFAMAGPLSGQLPGDPTVQTLFDNLTFVDWLAFILFLATVPAVVEEILFRGFIQRRLLERWRPLWAVGVTSGLFALMHGASAGDRGALAAECVARSGRLANGLCLPDDALSCIHQWRAQRLAHAGEILRCVGVGTVRYCFHRAVG